MNRISPACLILAACWASPAGAGKAAERPRYPFQAALRLEGMVRAARCIGVGRFVHAEKKGRVQIGTFRCDEAIKGTWAKGRTYSLNSATIRWRRFSDADDILVFFPLKPGKHQGRTLGAKKETLGKIKAACAQDAANPVGGINALGLHLRASGPAPRARRLSFDVVNYSTVPWTVNVGRKVPRLGGSDNRSVWVRVVKVASSGAASPDTRRRAAAYASDRPWLGMAVIDTARGRKRPDRPVPGATVRLTPGAKYTGVIEFRRTGTSNQYMAYINGHRDLGRPFILEPALYQIVAGLDDDYHYYTGNGARIGWRDYWFGTLVSNAVRLDLRRDRTARGDRKRKTKP